MSTSPDGTASSGVFKTIVAAVVIGLLAGGSAPWWWDKVFPPRIAVPTVKQDNNSPTAKPRMGPLQHGWNYPHNDINADDWLSVGSAEACSDLCYARPECKAMTYVISNKSCWLKYAVPDRTQNGDMISAVKQESN